MRQRSRGQLVFATFGPDHVVGKSDQQLGESDQLVGFQEDLRKLVLVLWTRGTPALHFAAYANISLRHAEQFLARKRGISLGVFRRCARGLHGEQFVKVLMGDATAAWWIEVTKERAITAVKRRRKELEDELRKLEAER